MTGSPGITSTLTFSRLERESKLLSFERPHGRLERLYAFLVHGGSSARTLKTPERFVVFSIESSEQGHTVDALAPGADEGRGRLR